MFKALWFLLKLFALVALVAWVARHPGSVEMVWMGYLVETSPAFLLGLFLFVLLGWTLIYRAWRSFVSVPAAFRRYQAAARREQGYRALTQGLVAIAAGDASLAHKYATRAQGLIPDAPLTRLLLAQNALLQGKPQEARRAFLELLDDRDAAFFGLRGLLSETIAAKDYAGALDVMRRADALQSKRPWIIRALFDLETRQGQWERAHKTLKRAEKIGIFDKRAAQKSRASLFMAQALDARNRSHREDALRFAAQALEGDVGFIPAATFLAQYYIQSGKKRRAMKILQKAYAKNPHPDLADLWLLLQPPTRKTLSIFDEGKDAAAWASELAKLNPQHRVSLQLQGQRALHARAWREARGFLQAAQDYRAMAELERLESGNDAKALEWLEKAADQPPEPVWVCKSCGVAGEQWRPLCPSCGIFDGFEWVVPRFEAHSPRNSLVFGQDILSAPVLQPAS